MQDISERTLYQIALTKIPLIGPVLAKNLVSYCGGVAEVFSAKKKHLLKIPGIGEKITDSILNQLVLTDAEEELNFIQKHNVQTFFYLDHAYPFRLKRYKDAPLMLYYKGNADLNHARILSVVGTRKPTSYGVRMVESIIDQLKPYDPLILSGLAYGVDICAHRAALQAGLSTIGVMGNGMAKLYPVSHKKTAREMILQGGILTEFHSDMAPNRENFPMRNRIIAGLCDVLVVAESKIRGGSMITAEMANYYYKDVYAVPGRMQDEISEGCNFLIKSNRAILLHEIEDIPKSLGWESDQSNVRQTELFVELTENESLVAELLDRDIPVSIDKIYKEVNLSSSQLASALLSLEFKGKLKALPGKMYLLIG